jgi:ectoine hydroxylase-related dioxygenase (phytanoyl-CoA dioxygenase family)
MSSLSPTQLRSYRDDGYMIVPGFFSADQLALMRGECEHGIEDMHRRMDAAGTDVLHISHRGSRYFINHQIDRSAALRALAFGAQMAELCRATLGDEVYFFLDQFVVKCAETGMRFAWHQDAGYITHTRVKPYLTCWIPLDDCSVANGTIFILPYSRMGHRDVIEHVKDEGTNDMVGYSGDDPGIAVEVPAGTLVAFTSHVLHRSTPNASRSMRRAYLLQYSPQPIYGPDGKPQNKIEAFLQDGVRVAH